MISHHSRCSFTLGTTRFPLYIIPCIQNITGWATARARISKVDPGRRVNGHEKKEINMVTVGALARFEFKPGNEAAIERFFQDGQPIVQRQPVSTLWFGFRLGPTTYGAFGAFANEEDRHALLSTGGPVLAKKNAELFAQPPIFEKVDILAAKLPNNKEGNVVTRGFLIRYEVKDVNKAGIVEHSIKEGLPRVQE